MENMISTKTYDSVVYSASLGGILGALALREGGLNPLLMNPTGFLGGDITQTLACIQVKPENNALAMLPPELLRLLTDQFDTIESNKMFIDPESWKWVLRVLIKELQIPALFHVKPQSILTHGEGIEMAYMDRQGSKTVSVKRVVDCTVRGDLLYRMTGRLSVKENNPVGCLNLSCTDIPPDTQLPGIDITQLPGRQWIQKSLSDPWLDNPGLEFDAELESISKTIQDTGGQLQMVPMRPLVFPDPSDNHDTVILNPWSKSIQNSEDILRTEWEMGVYVSSIL